MTFRQILKKALPLWVGLIFVDALLVEATDVVRQVGWGVAAERFALAVVAAYPISVAITYRIVSGRSWYRIF
jgi:hypothetical protein